MAHTHILLHIVWGTKHRAPLLGTEIRALLFAHIREYTSSKGIELQAINGWVEHVHCFVRLRADMSVAQCVQYLKGESAHWLNKQKLLRVHFGWADEYYAVSVSESNAVAVRKYIEAQEEHHRVRGYREEVERLCMLHMLPLPECEGEENMG